MPECVFAQIVVPGKQLHAGIFFYGAGQVPNGTVHLNGQHIAGKSLANAGGDLEACYTFGILAYRAVWQSDVDHVLFLGIVLKAPLPDSHAVQLGSGSF